MEKTPLTIQEVTKEIKKILSHFPQSQLSGAVAINALGVIQTFLADSPKAWIEEPFVGRGMDLDDLKAMADGIPKSEPPEIPPWEVGDPPF